MVTDRHTHTQDKYCNPSAQASEELGKLLQESARLNSESTQLLYAKSFGYSNDILEALFEVEEIQSAIRKLKCGKRGGANGLQPEHIKYGGHSIILWFQSIFNKISTLEDIPPCLTIPVFKGKGRDPLNPNNYRGITLTSVISKCLE